MKEHREGGWWQTGLNTVPNLKHFDFWYELVIPLWTQKDGLIVSFPITLFKLRHQLPRFAFGTPVSWLVRVDPRAEEKNRCLKSLDREEFLRCDK